MGGNGEQIPPLVDEVVRLAGRLLAATAELAAPSGLSAAELQVLVAVVGAERPPTVPQIGRSFGHSRQAVQRLADGLARRGLIEFIDNPEHKRARRLVATRAGHLAHQAIEPRSQAWADVLSAGIPGRDLESAVATLRTLRERLEADARTAVSS